MQEEKALRSIFAENLRKRRIQLSLSQEEFADICGLHRTYISDVERGSRNVSINNIERIAKALGVSAYELLKEGNGDDCC